MLRRRRPPDAPMEAGLVVPGLSALVRQFMYWHWAEIGVAAYARATPRDPGAAVNDCIVAITSAAFCIDSFARDLPFADPPQPTACSLQGTAHVIWDLVRHNCEAPVPERWHDELHWLFDLRNSAVHHEGSRQPAHFDAASGTHYGPLARDFNVANAQRALVLAHEVTAHCLDYPSQAALREFIATNLPGASAGSPVRGIASDSPG